MSEGYPDSLGLSWNGLTNINAFPHAFPPSSGLSFPPNNVAFPPSYVGIGSNSGSLNSAVPVPDAMFPTPSENHTFPHEHSKPLADHLSSASANSPGERSITTSSWGENEQGIPTLVEDDNSPNLLSSSVGTEEPGLAVFSKDTDSSFDVIDKLSVETTRLSTIADGLSSTMSRLSEVVNKLPTTTGELSDTASDLSQTLALLSFKVEGISSFHEDLNARIQQIFDTVDKLSDTVSEMVKREGIVMEAFTALNERPERSKVPFQFQSKATRKRK
ncbi:hypothetical protein N7449_011225 [Penicillium cf. viridicatum]|uniref:Uncharacterized protein n=1 Tax=Penicillium cf. viridicatum TaxID=2972119 RepID=A0A9W9M1U6_9EURO|nr:hypothetical protein N7449_011225 [Penicillium cf. viridicatum]